LIALNTQRDCEIPAAPKKEASKPDPKTTEPHETNHDEPGFAWICPDRDAHPSAFTPLWHGGVGRIPSLKTRTTLMKLHLLGFTLSGVPILQPPPPIMGWRHEPQAGASNTNNHDEVGFAWIHPLAPSIPAFLLS